MFRRRENGWRWLYLEIINNKLFLNSLYGLMMINSSNASIHPFIPLFGHAENAAFVDTFCDKLPK